MIRALIASAVLFAATVASAQEAAPPTREAAAAPATEPEAKTAAQAKETKGPGGPPQDWKYRLTFYGRAKPTADLDRGDASVGVYRAGMSASVGRFIGYIRLGASISAERTDYDFSETDNLNSPPDPPTPDDPWKVLSFVRLNLNAMIPFGRSPWSLFVFGGLRIGWENGTEIDDAISGTFFAAIGYQFDKTLTLQLGVIAITRIEDSPIAFPVFGVRWTPNDWIRLETRGPGIEFGIKPVDSLELTLGARYDNRQYRLEDRRVTLAGHIVEDQEVLVELGANWAPIEQVTIRGAVGLVAYQEFEIREEDGDVRFRSRTDPAPYFELRVSLAF